MPPSTVSIDRSSGPAVLRRTAILISSLPEPTARGLLARLSADQRRQLRRAIATLDDVDALERHRAVQTFYQSMRQSIAQTPPAARTPPVVAPQTPAASDAPQPAATAELTPERQPPQVTDPLAFLNTVDSGRLYRTLCTEHPQTVAVVLANLPPPAAAAILQRMPDARRSETIARLGRLGSLDRDVAADIAATLRQKLGTVVEPPDAQTPSPPPTNRLREILSQMPGSDQTPKIEPTVSNPPISEPVTSATEASEQVDQLRRVAALGSDPPTIPLKPVEESISDAEADRLLISLPPLRLCEALGRVDTQTAVRTLQGLPTATVKAAIGALPRSIARRVRRQVADIDGVSLRQIDSAKRQVAQLAARPAASAAA